MIILAWDGHAIRGGCNAEQNPRPPDTNATSFVLGMTLSIATGISVPATCRLEWKERQLFADEEGRSERPHLTKCRAIPLSSPVSPTAPAVTHLCREEFVRQTNVAMTKLLERDSLRPVVTTGEDRISTIAPRSPIFSLGVVIV